MLNPQHIGQYMRLSRVYRYFIGLVPDLCTNEFYITLHVTMYRNGMKSILQDTFYHMYIARHGVVIASKKYVIENRRNNLFCSNIKENPNSHN